MGWLPCCRCVMNLFEYLKYGLAAVLSFIGIKMVLMDIYHISILAALGVVGGILVVSILASIIWPSKKNPKLHPPTSNGA